MNADLTFLLEPAGTLDTLEAILATARRGGLTLGGLRLHRAGRDDLVYLRLRSDDADLLDLFTLRLNNIIGVHEIRRLPVDQLYIPADELLAASR